MVKKYIYFSPEKRKNFANSFDEDFFKLMINSVYGKAMENSWKRNVRLVNNEKDYLKHVNKPIFISQKIFNTHFAAIHEIKPVLTLNKPIYVGFTVLGLSKWLMHYFHHNFITKSFDASLLFTNTDSLMRSNQNMFIKNFLNANTCLTLVNINEIFLIQLTKKL